MLLGEECVKMIPEHIPSACLDSHVDIIIIRKYFDENGWAALLSVFEENKCLGTVTTVERFWRTQTVLAVTVALIGSTGGVQLLNPNQKLSFGIVDTVNWINKDMVLCPL